MALDHRKATILKEVVFRYITTGTPVGSATLCESLDLGISPATVRNELSRLEEMGYLYHPHTSAGRIPTTLGYRYYVDSLSGRTRLHREEKEAVLALFSAKSREMERTLQEATDLLSRLTHSLAMVITPPLRQSTLKHVDLVALNERMVLLVIITNTGRVEKELLEIEEPLADDLLRKAQNYLNRRLRDLDFEKLEKIGQVKSSLPPQAHPLLNRICEVIKDMLTREESEGVFIMGKANLVKAHQKEDIERIEQLMEALEQQCFILSLVREVVSEKQLLVRIGNENLLEELRGFSLVATPYTVGEDQLGTIGVLGPMRMDYARIIPTVDFLARSLSKSLQMLRG